MSLVKLYKNGSYKTQINLETGTRYYFGDTGSPDFPDSIDLKITEWCPWGCPFCYESSGTSGRHSYTSKLLSVLSELPKVPLEIAIGGGSAPDHPDFRIIKEFVTGRGNIANLTVTQRDLGRLNPEVFEGISGLGVSVGSGLVIDPKTEIPGPKQVVYHVIAGITPVSNIQKLVESSQKILVLGYKNLGRAKTDALPNLKETESYLKQVIRRNPTRATLVFDELSIQQLQIRKAVIESTWKMLYQGPEFSHSMFLDAVTGEYFPSSSTDRTSGVSWDSMKITEYFKKYHVRDSY